MVVGFSVVVGSNVVVGSKVVVALFATVYSIIPYFWVVIAKYYQMKYGYHWKLQLCFWLLPKDLETTQFLIMMLGRKVNKKRALTVAGVVMSVLVLAFSCKQLWNFSSKLKFQGRLHNQGAAQR